jgi:hypothetical protein
MKEECKKFLIEELNIELSEEKTQITNVTKDNVRFLGVDIKRNVSEEAKVIQRVVKGRLIKSRINSTRLYFYMPVLHIMKKLSEAGFIKTYISQAGVSKQVPNAVTK